MIPTLLSKRASILTNVDVVTGNKISGLFDIVWSLKYFRSFKNSSREL